MAAELQTNNTPKIRGIVPEVSSPAESPRLSHSSFITNHKPRQPLEKGLQPPITARGLEAAANDPAASNDPAAANDCAAACGPPAAGPTPSNPPSTPTTLDPNYVSFASTPPPPPTPTPTPTQESNSSPGDVYMCASENFTATCSYEHTVTHQCHNLKPEWRKLMTSIRPDKNQVCFFFDRQDCYGEALWLRWPGTGNLGEDWNDRVVSWECSEDGCEGVQGPGGCSENPEGLLREKVRRGVGFVG